MKQVGTLVVTALCMIATPTRADVNGQYLPPGSRPPSGQYLPPPPLQFPADAPQPPSFEDPESIIIEADPFARGLNFPKGSGAVFRLRGQQRNFNSQVPLNYFPRSSPTYASLVDNSITPALSSVRNQPVFRYVTAPLPSQYLPPAPSLSYQQSHGSHAANNRYPATTLGLTSNQKQSGYSYEIPKVPFLLPGENYRNSHVNVGLQQQSPITPSALFVSKSDLSSNRYTDYNVNKNTFNVDSYQSNPQQRNQREGHSY